MIFLEKKVDSVIKHFETHILWKFGQFLFNSQWFFSFFT